MTYNAKMNWLFNYIYKLQHLPIAEKKKKARFIAGVLTAIIFLFWISTLAISKNTDVAQEEVIDITPLRNIKDAFGEINNSLGKMKDGLKSIESDQNSGTTTLQ